MNAYLHTVKHEVLHICGGVIFLRPPISRKDSFIRVRSDYKRIPWVVRDMGSNLSYARVKCSTGVLNVHVIVFLFLKSVTA